LAQRHQIARLYLRSPAGIVVGVVVMSACPTCGALPCINPSFCATCRDADRRKKRPKDLARLRRLISDDVSLERAWSELNDACNHPTPKATIDAIMFAVRERGLAALKEPATAQRLEHCDEAAKAEIERRIANLRKD
jgi:hypothetical protein